MPRAATKKAPRKAPKGGAPKAVDGALEEAVPRLSSPLPSGEDSATPRSEMKLEPPTQPVETRDEPEHSNAVVQIERRDDQHRRTAGHGHAGPEPQSPRNGHREFRHHAQARVDLPNPAEKRRARRRPLFRGRAGNSARRLRVSALPQFQLSALPGGHLRFAVANPPFRPANRQPDRRPDSSAQGQGALFRPAQSRGRRYRRAGQSQGQNSF